MNFMIVTDTFPPDINGVARTLQILSRGLARRGHNIRVLTTTSECNDDPDISVKQVRALPLPGYSSVRLGLTSTKQLSREIHDHQSDALYVAVETPMGIHAIHAAKKNNIAVVSGFHTNFHNYSTDYSLPLLKNLASRYLRWVHNKTHRTLTPSEGTAAQLRELGLQNVSVLGRGVDTELFHPQRRSAALRQSWGANNETPVAIFVSRMASEKNLPLAVKTFLHLSDINPLLRCVFVGDGPKSASLRKEFPQFIYAGTRSSEDLAQHYASADFFVFPSLTETFGNVLTEALASGLVSVSFDYAAAQQHVVSGVNGFTAPFGDEAAFLKSSEKAMNHWSDNAMRACAAKTAEHLSWNKIVEQFESELCNAALQKHRSQSS